MTANYIILTLIHIQYSLYQAYMYNVLFIIVIIIIIFLFTEGGPIELYSSSALGSSRLTKFEYYMEHIITYLSSDILHI